jgi:hypothetical protein
MAATASNTDGLARCYFANITTLGWDWHKYLSVQTQ